MPRRPAKFTKTEVERAIKAAQSAGAGGVEIKPDGTIRVILSPPSTPMLGAVDMDGSSEELDRELAEFEAAHGEG